MLNVKQLVDEQCEYWKQLNSETKFMIVVDISTNKMY